MASRRNRIKGIPLNIPQRKKTDSVPNPEIEATCHPEIKQDSQQPNPTSDIREELALIPPKQQIEQNTTTEKSQEDDDKKEEVVEKVEEIKPAEPQPKPIPTARRKFIKPTVSINSINRKSREENKQPQEPPVNKIVNLSDIVTTPALTNNVGNIEEALPPCKDLGREIENNLVSLSTNITTNAARIEPITLDCDPKPQNSPNFSELEYPAPPLSPSKINRSRIKAVPRLGQRNTSFSASESEDESKRNYRHRNDSVCSTISGINDSNSISECFSPQKPKEFNTIIQRKCRRTEQSRKLAEARRDFYQKFGNNKPDRQKLTMLDLIFYNPTTNLMGDSKKAAEEAEEGSNEVAEEKVDDPIKSGSDEENEIPAPQIKIGPQGEIVIDEQSLVIENKSVKRNRAELQKSRVVDGDLDTGYGVYKRAKRSKDWSKEETLKFYKALNTIGTDFTLMCDLFPRRSRRELKMKFKKEERVNKTLIDMAIMKPSGFEFADFKHEVDMEEKELQAIEQQKIREQELKESRKRKASLAKADTPEAKKEPPKPPKPKRKRGLNIMDVLKDDDTDEADESETESIEDDSHERLLQSMAKPTRSGRVPKILKRRAPPPPRQVTHEPGSLMVHTRTGPKGESVYEVFMVTADQSTKALGSSMSSLSEAIRYKDNCNVTGLFTVSATPLERVTVTPPIEENITIPAEN